MVIILKYKELLHSNKKKIKSPIEKKWAMDITKQFGEENNIKWW